MASILVVEDDTLLRDVLVELLTEEGYDVGTASHGLEALHLLTAWRPDLIMLDIMMPVMHGVTLSHYLNADPELSSIPLIMMSGLKNRPLIDSCVYQGFLDKPFHIDTVLALVTSLLAGGGKTNAA